MRQSPIYLAFGFLLAIAGLPITGCSAIGYVFGSSIDASNSTASLTPLPSVSEMEEGELYWVVKIDSSGVLGEYVGLPPPDNLPSPHELYDKWRDADSSRRNMPRCRDSVEITLDTSVPRYLHGRLDRISTDSLWVVGYGTLRPPIRGISLREVRTLTSTTGGRIEGQDLRDKAAGMVLSPPRRLPPEEGPPKKSPPKRLPGEKDPPRKGSPTTPPPSTLVLRVDAGSEHMLPVDSIAFVYLVEHDIPSQARWGYMALGMVVDGLLVLGWIAYVGKVIPFSSI